jgi:hypothetical protein
MVTRRIPEVQVNFGLNLAYPGYTNQAKCSISAPGHYVLRRQCTWQSNAKARSPRRPGPGSQQSLAELLRISAPKPATEDDTVATAAYKRAAIFAVKIGCIAKRRKLGRNMIWNSRSKAVFSICTPMARCPWPPLRQLHAYSTPPVHRAVPLSTPIELKPGRCTTRCEFGGSEWGHHGKVYTDRFTNCKASCPAL